MPIAVLLGDGPAPWVERVAPTPVTPTRAMAILGYHDLEELADIADQLPGKRAAGLFDADAATIKVSGCRVVNGVCTAPHIIRCQREDAERAAKPIVQRAVTEERTVAAIMLDDEQPHEEGSGRQHEDQRRPDLMGEAEEDPSQERQEGQGGAKQIENAAPAMRPRIGRDQPAPARGRGRGLDIGSWIFRGDRIRIGRKRRKAGAARRT